MSVKGLKLPPEPLTPFEIRQLLGVISRTSSTGIRNLALIVLLWRGGPRLSEALALRPKDLSIENSTCRILHGKGDKARVIALDPGALAILQLWLQRREALEITSKSTIFCTLKGERLKTSYVRSLLPRLAKKAGIEKRVHAHGLRHTHAFELLSEGQPLNVISIQLGHSNLATTERYLRHLNPQAVVDAIKGRTWEL